MYDKELVLVYSYKFLKISIFFYSYVDFRAELEKVCLESDFA